MFIRKVVFFRPTSMVLRGRCVDERPCGIAWRQCELATTQRRDARRSTEFRDIKFFRVAAVITGEAPVQLSSVLPIFSTFFYSVSGICIGFPFACWHFFGRWRPSSLSFKPNFQSDISLICRYFARNHRPIRDTTLELIQMETGSSNMNNSNQKRANERTNERYLRKSPYSCIQSPENVIDKKV